MLQNQTLVRSGGELTFGQAIHTVVFDNIEHWNVAADDMFEVTHTDAGSITITRNTQDFNLVVGKTSAGHQSRHAAVQTIETKGAIQEVVRALTGTANTTNLDNLLRCQTKLKNSSLDNVGNGVVATSGTEG